MTDIGLERTDTRCKGCGEYRTRADLATYGERCETCSVTHFVNLRRQGPMRDLAKGFRRKTVRATDLTEPLEATT